jgi:hypothetical protein
MAVKAAKIAEKPAHRIHDENSGFMFSPVLAEIALRSGHFSAPGANEMAASFAAGRTDIGKIYPPFAGARLTPAGPPM